MSVRVLGPDNRGNGGAFATGLALLLYLYRRSNSSVEQGLLLGTATASTLTLAPGCGSPGSRS